MDMFGVHVVTLNSYAALKKGSTQQQWLWQDLQSVDRTKTPWVIVMMHVPLYNSNEKHWGEQYFLLHQLEDVLYNAGANGKYVCIFDNDMEPHSKFLTSTPIVTGTDAIAKRS